MSDVSKFTYMHTHQNVAKLEHRFFKSLHTLWSTALQVSSLFGMIISWRLCDTWGRFKPFARPIKLLLIFTYVALKHSLFMPARCCNGSNWKNYLITFSYNLLFYIFYTSPFVEGIIVLYFKLTTWKKVPFSTSAQLPNSASINLLVFFIRLHIYTYVC